MAGRAVVVVAACAAGRRCTGHPPGFPRKKSGHSVNIHVITASSVVGPDRYGAVVPMKISEVIRLLEKDGWCLQRVTTILLQAGLWRERW
jgi:hypothetical protein